MSKQNILKATVTKKAASITDIDLNDSNFDDPTPVTLTAGELREMIHYCASGGFVYDYNAVAQRFSRKNRNDV